MLDHSKYENINRREERIIHQLRTGECPLTKRYLKRTNQSENDVCDDCNVSKDDINNMLLECPRFEIIRRNIFGLNPNLTILEDKPEDVIKYLLKIGRLKDS